MYERRLTKDICVISIHSGQQTYHHHQQTDCECMTNSERDHDVFGNKEDIRGVVSYFFSIAKSGFVLGQLHFADGRQRKHACAQQRGPPAGIPAVNAIVFDVFVGVSSNFCSGNRLLMRTLASQLLGDSTV